jgi:hypothetical protein
MAYFQAMENPDKIIYPIDRRWFSPGLFQCEGFVLEAESTPACWYMEDKKYTTRLTEKETNLENQIEYLDSLENLAANGYDRIWDCGSLLFVK